MTSYASTYGPSLKAYTNVTTSAAPSLNALASLSKYIAQSSVLSISGTTLTSASLPTGAITNNTLTIPNEDNSMSDFTSSNLIMHQNIFDGEVYILANLPGNTAAGAMGSTGVSVNLMNGNTGLFNVDSSSVIGYNTAIGIEVTDGNKDIQLTGSTSATGNNWTAETDSTDAGVASEKTLLYYGYSSNSQTHALSVGFTGNTGYLCTQYKTTGELLSNASTIFDDDINYDIALSNVVNTSAVATGLAFGTYKLDQPALNNVTITNSMDNIRDTWETTIVNTTGASGLLGDYFNVANGEMYEDYYWEVRQTVGGTGYSLVTDTMVTTYESSVIENETYMRNVNVTDSHQLFVINAKLEYNTTYITLDNTAETLTSTNYQNNSYVYFKNKAQNSSNNETGRSYVNSNTINGLVAPSVYVQYQNDTQPVFTGAANITGKAMTEYNVNYTVNVVAGSSNQYWTLSNSNNNNMIVDSSSSLLLNIGSASATGITCKLGYTGTNLDLMGASYANNDAFTTAFNNIAKFEADVNIFNVYTNIDASGLTVYGATVDSITYTGYNGREGSFTGTNSYCTSNLFADISNNKMDSTSTVYPGIKVSAKGYGSKSQYPLNFSLQVFAKCGDSIMYDLSKNAVGCQAVDWKLGVLASNATSVNTKTPLDTNGANIAVGILHSLTDGSFPGISSNISGFKIYPVATNKTVNMYVDILNTNGDVLSKNGPYKLNGVTASSGPSFGLTGGNKVYSFVVSGGAFNLNLGAYDNLYVQYPTMYAAYQAGNANTDINTTYSSTDSSKSVADNVSMTFKFINNFNALKTHFAQFVTTSNGLSFGTGTTFVTDKIRDIDLWYDVSNKTTLMNGTESVDFTCEYTDTGKTLSGTTMAWVNLNTSTRQYDINNYSIYNTSAENITNNYRLNLTATTNDGLNILQSLSVVDTFNEDSVLATIYFDSNSTPSNNYHLYWCPKTIFSITATNATSSDFNTQPVSRLGQTTKTYNNTDDDWLNVDTGVYLKYAPSTVYRGTMMFSLSNDMYSHNNGASASSSPPSYTVSLVRDTLTTNALSLDGSTEDTGYMKFKLNQYRGACSNNDSNNVVTITRTPAQAKVLLNNISKDLVDVYNGASFNVIVQSDKLQLSDSNSNRIGLRLTFSQSYSKHSNYGQNLQLNSSSNHTYDINLSYNTYTVTTYNNGVTATVGPAAPVGRIIGTVGNDAFKASTPYKIQVRSIYGGTPGNSFKVKPDMTNYKYTISSCTANDNSKTNNITANFENSALLYYSDLRSGYRVPNTFIKLTKQSTKIPTLKSYYFQFVIPKLKFTTAINNHELDTLYKDISMTSNTYNPFSAVSTLNNTTFRNTVQGTTVSWYWNYVRTSFGPATFALNSPKVKLYQNYDSAVFKQVIYDGYMHDLYTLGSSPHGAFNLTIDSNASSSMFKASFLQDYSRYNLVNNNNRIIVNIPKWIYYNGTSGQYKTCYANVVKNNSQMCAIGSVINRNDFGFPTSVEVLLYTTDNYSSTIYESAINKQSNNLTTISFPFTSVYRTSYPINASSLSESTINFNALIKSVSINSSPYLSSALPASDAPFYWSQSTSVDTNWVKSSSLPSLPMLYVTPVNKKGTDVLINFVNSVSTLNTINMCVSRSLPIRVTVDNALNIISEIDEAGNFIGKDIEIHS